MPNTGISHGCANLIRTRPLRFTRTRLRSLGIGNGEWVWIENWLSRQKFKAKLTLAVLPQMVMAAHGWWFPEEEGAEPSLFGAWKSNINQLIPMGSQGKDGLGAPIKNLLCRVYKVQDRDE